MNQISSRCRGLSSQKSIARAAVQVLALLLPFHFSSAEGPIWHGPAVVEALPKFELSAPFDGYVVSVAPSGAFRDGLAEPLEISLEMVRNGASPLPSESTEIVRIRAAQLEESMDLQVLELSDISMALAKLHMPTPDNDRGENPLAWELSRSQLQLAVRIRELLLHRDDAVIRELLFASNGGAISHPLRPGAAAIFQSIISLPRWKNSDQGLARGVLREIATARLRAKAHIPEVYVARAPSEPPALRPNSQMLGSYPAGVTIIVPRYSDSASTPKTIVPLRDYWKAVVESGLYNLPDVQFLRDLNGVNTARSPEETAVLLLGELEDAIVYQKNSSTFRSAILELTDSEFLDAQRRQGLLKKLIPPSGLDRSAIEGYLFEVSAEREKLPGYEDLWFRVAARPSIKPYKGRYLTVQEEYGPAGFAVATKLSGARLLELSMPLNDETVEFYSSAFEARADLWARTAGRRRLRAAVALSTGLSYLQSSGSTWADVRRNVEAFSRSRAEIVADDLVDGQGFQASWIAQKRSIEAMATAYQGGVVTVPQPVIVEQSFAKPNSLVSQGDTIALLRLINVHRLSLRNGEGSFPGVGSPATIKVDCGDALVLLPDERRRLEQLRGDTGMIQIIKRWFGMGDDQRLARALSTIQRERRRSTVYDAVVEGMSERPVNGSRSTSLRLSLPERARGAFPASISDRDWHAAKLIGVAIDDGSGIRKIVFRGGLIEPGLRCTAELMSGNSFQALADG